MARKLFDNIIKLCIITYTPTGDNIMKLSITELKEIKEQLDKGLTLCLPQSISLKQYDSIIKQIDNYIKKEA